MSASLLPPNATALERAISEAAAKRLAAIATPLRTLWDPATCPLAHLPWLAWAVSVDAWDADWPEATKRSVIADSIALHRRKGTPWAVRRSLELMGFSNVEILEGTNIRLDGSHLLDGSWTLGNQFGPYEFGVLLNAASSIYAGGGATGELTAEVVTEIHRRIDDAKNERSQLAALYSYYFYLDGTYLLDGNQHLNGGML